MRDLRKYWAEVNAIRRGLADFVWLAPEGEGSLVEVSAAVAARLLQARSHRLAAGDEVAAHREAEDAARQRAFQGELRRKGIAVVPVGAGPRAVR
jgi:hypothetical protein